MGRVTRFVVGLGLVLGADAAQATKPCPESVCYPMTRFDEPACTAAAAWIFTGKIIKVVDHPTGEPTFKNFAEFTVQIDRWEKHPPKDPPRTITFRVGWCKNGRVLPDKRTGRFRFWGAGEVSAREPEYLWFEPL